MDSQRNLLFLALLLVSFLIWTTWQQDKVKQKLAPTYQATHVEQDGIVDGHSGQRVIIKNDILSLTVDTSGGDIRSAFLLDYNATLGSDAPFELLKVEPNFMYVAQSGLIGRDGIDREGQRPLYQVDKAEYQLADGQDELKVPFTFTTNGVTFVKTFTIKRNSYVVGVAYDIKNTTDSPLEVIMYGQLKQTEDVPKAQQQSTGGFGMSAYRGAAYSTDDNNYKKYSFSDIQSSNLSIDTQKGWIAMLQQYFATAWIPEQSEIVHRLYSNKFNDAVTGSPQAAVGFKTSAITVAAQSDESFGARLWIGPELQNEMDAVVENLDLVVDYGWFWFISQPLFKLLKFIQSFVVNWGVAIILITFIVRGLMYPLTRAQYTSMAKMKLLQPRVEAMRERFGDDKQRFSQEMMALYRQEKVNPLGGCLPIIIQMPIFLGLFYMLSSSVELRHAPFMLWIQDLSAQDPFYILPLLMGGTMFLIQKMSPTTVADPMQQKIMTFLPVIFTLFFLWFPSGLVLYYTVSNIVTIVQQKLIYRGLEKRGLHAKTKNNHLIQQVNKATA